MHREIICPGCGQVIPLDEPSPKAGRSPLASAKTVETIIPCTVCVDGPLDASDQSPGVEQAYPPAVTDPAGHAHVYDTSPVEPAPGMGEPPILSIRKGPAAPGEGAGSGETLPSSTARAIVDREAHSDPFLAALVSSIPGEGSEDSPDGRSQREATGLPDLNLHSAVAPARLGEPNSAPRATKATPPPEVEHEPSRFPLGVTLLGSYASAVTIALAWLLWTGWGRSGNTTPTLPGSTRLEVLDNDGSSLVTRLPEIADDKSTSLGRPLRVGQLEVTPLSIRSDRVRLVSTTGSGRRNGGDDAFHLRLKLRNTSAEHAVVPFDPAFVREPDHGPPESLIVAEGRTILPFPLAVQSDWSIPGQAFSPLKPGEERDFVVVSAPESLDKATPRMSWRLRIRVSKDKTELIEVDFSSSDIGSM